MTARRILPAALLVVAAVAVTLVLILRGGGGDQQPQLAEDTPEIDVQLVLSPRTPAFGDILTATVGVTVDRRRVDPDSVRVRQEFSPWGQIAKPQQTRDDSEHTSFISTTYSLRCVISPCVPQRDTSQLEFDPAVVAFRRLERPEAVTHDRGAVAGARRPLESRVRRPRAP